MCYISIELIREKTRNIITNCEKSDSNVFSICYKQFIRNSAKEKTWFFSWSNEFFNMNIWETIIN